MNTSQNGISLIKKWEGCVLQVYVDVTGTKTLGYGHTGADVNTLPVGARISQEQADAYLKADLSKFEANVNRYDSTYHWTQNEFDALCSFAFNVGSIDQLVNNGLRTKAVIADKMLLYNKSKGIVLEGLTNRRKSERQLFLKDGAESPEDKYIPGQVYTLVANLYIRESVRGNKIKMDCITENAKQNANFDSEGYAILKKGTKVTCKEIKTMDDETWILIPSGYICAKQGDKIYVN